MLKRVHIKHPELVEWLKTRISAGNSTSRFRDGYQVLCCEDDKTFIWAHIGSRTATMPEGKDICLEEMLQLVLMKSVRFSTKDNRIVIVFSDGSVEYADMTIAASDVDEIIKERQKIYSGSAPKQS